MSTAPDLSVWVHTLAHEAQGILRIELRAQGGAELPAFTPGAHIDLRLPNGISRSYSLCNDSQERHRYVLGVLLDKNSRGGSQCVHNDLRIGMALKCSPPANHFPLHEEAEHTTLVAGGIGITPLLAMARRLRALGKNVQLFYLARAADYAAFRDVIEQLAIPIHWHLDATEGGPPDLVKLLAQRPASTNDHYYACGPGPMLDAFLAACDKLGHTNAHIERFAAQTQAPTTTAEHSYTVELRRSGQTLTVGPGTTLYKELKAKGINVAFSCEEGICGSCETRVLEGTPDHLDSVLSPSERATNKSMMVCVSGCKGERLVLDL